jgi:hypothetical protein
MRDAALSGTPKDDDWYAEQMAKAITGQIKTADVNAGIAVSGGSLASAAASAKGSLS